MMEERQAKKRQKNLDKKQQLLGASAAGANGEVAALDAVRFTGTFGVSYAPEQQAMTKQQLRTARMTGALMATDADELPTSVGCLTSLSAKKQEGFEIGRRNYLIKKSNKVDRKKVSSLLICCCRQGHCLLCQQCRVQHAIAKTRERKSRREAHCQKENGTKTRENKHAAILL